MVGLKNGHIYKSLTEKWWTPAEEEKEDTQQHEKHM